MASAKALLGSVLGPLLFRSARVASATLLEPRLLRLVLASPSLVGVEGGPGQKVQLFLPEIGMRTYSPVEWDAAKGSFELLVLLHADTPGPTFARALAVGAPVQFMGPRRSTPLEAGRALVLFGDETSFAVARAFELATPGSVQAVFEVTGRAAWLPVLDTLGLGSAHLVERAAEGTHLVEAGLALVERLRARPEAALVTTGRASSIQSVRSQLKASGLLRAGASKAYWAPGKVGLD